MCICVEYWESGGIKAVKGSENSHGDSETAAVLLLLLLLLTKKKMMNILLCESPVQQAGVQ